MAYLRPDGKTQVTVEYDTPARPQRIDTVVVSSQHAADIDLDTMLAPDVKKLVVDQVLDSFAIDSTDYRLWSTPTGRFEIGGPMGDAGLTGRKVIIDTYGGMARHGGGAFSGKDPSKVDRSGAYAMRWVAKNIVAAGLARRCEVQVAYAIGKSHPVGFYIDCFGTEVCRSTASRAPRSRCSTCGRPRSSATSTCCARSTPRRPPTAISAGSCRSSPGSARIGSTTCVGLWTPEVGRPRRLIHIGWCPTPPRRPSGPEWPASRSRCRWPTWTARSTTRCRPSGQTTCGSGAGWTVWFAGRRVGGLVLAVSDVSAHEGRLQPLQRVVSSEPVLSAEVARLARTVADSYAGTLADVLRLAVPKRHARVEAEQAGPAMPEGPPAESAQESAQESARESAGAAAWAAADAGGDFLAAVRAGSPARVAWTGAAR
jgi:hypothetical protein